MLNNNIFKLFFNYRGELSRQKYWAGLVFLLMLLCFNIFNNFTLNTCHSIFIKLILINEDGFDWQLRTSINYLIENTFSVSLPTSFITLYCSIVITLKRSRLLIKNNFTKIFGGIILYLLLAVILAFIIFVTDNISNSISSTDTFILFSKILISFVALLIVLNIIVIIKLSKKTEKNNLIINNNKHATINTLFSIGKLILGLFSFLLIVAIFFNISTDPQYSIYDSISESISNFLCFIGAIIFIYILKKRASDAGLNSNTIYIPLLCYILLYFVTLILPVVYNSFFIKLGFIYKALVIIMNYANIASIIGIFILIGLPSKK